MCLLRVITVVSQQAIFKLAQTLQHRVATELQFQLNEVLLQLLV